jgi:hypothetical protein
MGLGEPVIQSETNSAIGGRNHNFVNSKVSAREEEVEQMI